MLSEVVEQPLDQRFVHRDRQHAVLEAIVEENVGKAGRDHHAETVVLQSPNGVLAAGAATEIAASHQDRSALDRRLVQLEVRVLAAVLVVTPVEEQELLVSRTLDPLQELLRNDLVRVHVGSVHHGHQAGEFRKCLHGRGLSYGL
jgi:hypothetical protein